MCRVLYLAVLSVNAADTVGKIPSAFVSAATSRSFAMVGCGIYSPTNLSQMAWHMSNTITIINFIQFDFGTNILWGGYYHIK